MPNVALWAATALRVLLGVENGWVGRLLRVAALRVRVLARVVARLRLTLVQLLLVGRKLLAAVVAGKLLVEVGIRRQVPTVVLVAVLLLHARVSKEGWYVAGLVHRQVAQVRLMRRALDAQHVVEVATGGQLGRVHIFTLLRAAIVLEHVDGVVRQVIRVHVMYLVRYVTRQLAQPVASTIAAPRE